MTRYDDDDDDAFDENGLLKDGRRMRVSMMMRDSTSDVQRAVAEDAAARRFGLRHALDLHQPGPRSAPTQWPTTRRAGLPRDVRRLVNAWRTSSAPLPEAAASAGAGNAAPARPTYDATEGRRSKAEAYNEMVDDMTSAWKGPAR